ncbi:hypothetical protein ACW7G2_03710 [Luteimonas sp. A277]
MRWPWRLLLSIVGALSAGVMAALAVTIVDLYLTGHGHLPLNQMGIGRLGPQVPVGDVILLASMLLSGLFVWFILRAFTRSR